MTPFPSYPSHIHAREWIGMIEGYKARYPGIAERIRRGSSAERIAELVGCEIWIPKAIKYSGRF